MASNIVSVSVDAEYPVAGVDNDSQGFRDNFRTIKDSLESARQEITDLQEKVVLKSALTDTVLENNLAGNSIISANLDQFTESFTPVGSVGNNQNISFFNGHYQSVTVTADVILTLADWPDAGVYAKMTVELVSNLNDGTERTIAIKSEGTPAFKRVPYPLQDNANDIGWMTGTSSTQVVVRTKNSTNPTIVEFWTTDGGLTVYANYIGITATDTIT